jgi:hypothetical protein
MIRGFPAIVSGTAAALAVAVSLSSQQTGLAQARQKNRASVPAPQPVERGLLDRYCARCHNDTKKTGGLSLAHLDPSHVDANAAAWEKVVRKLRTSAMPPPGGNRPTKAVADRFAARLEAALDHAAAAAPNPGRPTVHRLNRSEYVNVVRDLLAVDLDGPSLLPADNEAEGFDNMAGALTVSPILMERYLSAARRVSRLAVGDPAIGPSFAAQTYVLPTMLLQDERMSEDLPFGSRGGAAIRHRFPLDGEYRIKVLLRRTLYNFLRGLREPHQLEIRVDGELVKTFTVGGGDHGKPAPVSYSANVDTTGGTSAEWEEFELTADAHLEVLVPVAAGERVVGVSFVRRDYEPEGILQPPPSQFAFSIDESLSSPSGKREPAVESVAILGPYHTAGPGDTASRRRLFVCRPATIAEEAPCARRILATLARRAFRRPVTDRDLEPLLGFYEAGRGEGGFEDGVQEALARVLVDPEFLFRIEAPPPGTRPDSNYRLSDLQLASRLSFFLWSSLPDEELLELASRGVLSDPATLERQVRRLLADERSKALVENFAAEWLQLPNLRGVAPNPEIFPEAVFDENLRDAFRRETELFVESQLREDRGVGDMLSATDTFVNERLARHYGIPGVYGSRFRRVTLPNNQRGGLLGQGSILMLTSYADRTSPVLRGKWLLENVFGAPPPPPPPNVPALNEKDQGKPLSLRAAMERHRADPVCSTCHLRMDPLGFALENFDAIGRWRTISEAGTPIDASGELPDGSQFEGVAGLRRHAVAHRDDFVRTFTEKLLMYATGRGLEYYDMPTVRQILRDAAPGDYRWSSVILGITKSMPFQVRRSEP